MVIREERDESNDEQNNAAYYQFTSYLQVFTSIQFLKTYHYKSHCNNQNQI
jgi:hypothetical protein